MNILERLKHLKFKLANKCPDYRIEFACLVHKHNYYKKIISHELLNNHGLSGRDLDTCFEMSDGDIVVHGILKQAYGDNILMDRLKTDLGGECMKQWEATYRLREVMETAQTTLQF